MFLGLCVKYFEHKHSAKGLCATNSPSERQNQIGACSIQECRTHVPFYYALMNIIMGSNDFFSFSRSWEVAKYSSELWDLMIFCSFSRSREVAKHSSETT